MSAKKLACKIAVNCSHGLFCTSFFMFHKNTLKCLIVLFSMAPSAAFGQAAIESGSYDELNLAYDTVTKTVTGYYLNGTGWDEQTKSSRFICSFYFEGKLNGGHAKIKSYWPANSIGDTIWGMLDVTGPTSLKMRLEDDHGGCWNVQHFAEAPVDFKLDKAENWAEVRYVTGKKALFYSNTAESSIRKAYIVRGDVVYISKMQGIWAYCSYLLDSEGGRKVTEGWMKLEDLNVLH